MIQNIYKFHLIRQTDSMDCGAACLAMIINYYGRKIRQDAIYYNLSKDGISLLGISKVAEFYNIKTIGGLINFHSLSEKAKLPCIVHWNQNHFVVVYKIKKHKKGKYTIFIADPGKGLVTYTKEEFCEHWVSTKTEGEEKGIALLLEPTEQFYVQKTEETIPTHNRVKFLWSYLKKYNRFFTQLILGLLLGSLL